MASPAQIEANRRNAQHSTGPKTPEGRDRACRNHLKHGLLAQQAVLRTEDRSAYEEFSAAFREELAPRSLWEQTLAEQVIDHAWRLRRAAWMETSILDQALGQAVEKDARWRKDQWSAARSRAGAELRDALPEPFPRSSPEEVLPRFAGEALTALLYERNYLDVLRRYERALQRGMHEAMKALQAGRAAGAPQEAAGAAGETHAAPESASMECGDVCGSALDRPAAQARASEEAGAREDSELAAMTSPQAPAGTTCETNAAPAGASSPEGHPATAGAGHPEIQSGAADVSALHKAAAPKCDSNPILPAAPPMAPSPARNCDSKPMAPAVNPGRRARTMAILEREFREFWGDRMPRW